MPELTEMTTWFTQHTIREFGHGRVRLVEPEIVIEVTFDRVQASRRHKERVRPHVFLASSDCGRTRGQTRSIPWKRSKSWFPQTPSSPRTRQPGRWLTTALSPVGQGMSSFHLPS